MSNVAEDSGYRVLVEVAESMGLDGMEPLLRELYAIQKEHQFEKDRVTSISLMEKKILAEIDRLESKSHDPE